MNERECAILENEKALLISWEQVLEEHKRDMLCHMKAMEISFGEEAELKEWETSKRIKRFLEGKEDKELLALYVMYARYLLYCSSREGGLPANLQGIWADEIQTPWNGDWHLNAQQMIYWLAEKGNLSKSHLPYLELTKELVEPGRETAKAYYHARGWLVHTCTNPWGFTSPCEDASWGSTTGSPAWQCHHLWEHYLYTKEESYLKWAYPIMKEAVCFYLDMLVEDKEHGWLITSPSSSPENSFFDEKKRICSLCEGPSYDRQLIQALVAYCIQAQFVLKDDLEFIKELKKMQSKLAPIQIGSDGRIMEWGKEYEEAMIHHRHVSHLWGAYPGTLMTKEHTPNLANAVKKSLEARGTSTVGWAIAYRMCLWARLRESEKAYECIKQMFAYATGKNMWNLAYHCDETVENPELPDLEHCRYPFQIDGNEGNAAGILLFLEDDYATVLEDGQMQVEIVLLPALPKELSEGRVKGLCAKGNITMDFMWKDQTLVSGCFYGNEGDTFCVRYQDRLYSFVFDNTKQISWIYDGKEIRKEVKIECCTKQ